MTRLLTVLGLAGLLVAFGYGLGRDHYLAALRAAQAEAASATERAAQARDACAATLTALKGEQAASEAASRLTAAIRDIGEGIGDALPADLRDLLGALRGVRAAGD